MPTTDELVERRAPEIARVIQTAAKGSPLEADFRRPVEQALAQFADEAGVPLRTHHEYTLATGRADTVYNRLVVEYKRPGHLTKSRSNRNNLAAIEQVKGYVESIERSQLRWTERLGQTVAYDAYYLALAETLGGDFWTADRRLADSAGAVVSWVHWIGEIAP